MQMHTQDTLKIIMVILTEWSAIWSEIIRVTLKSVEYATRVRFEIKINVIEKTTSKVSKPQ